MNRRIIAIGGGDMKEKTTLKIDEYIANLAKEHAGDKRAYGLYIGTASHDFMPAFNTFRKTFTSVFDIKADVVLTVYTKMDEEKINDKFLKADFIYVGGGDTLFMLKHWKENNLLDKILDAYNRGVIITGRSAGAICWFDKMYTDSEMMNGTSDEFKVYDGLNILKGIMSPHYNYRQKDFDEVILKGNYSLGYGVEDNSAIEFVNENYTKSLTSGGLSYSLSCEDNELVKNVL